MRLDRLDAQEQLGGDRAVALARGGQLAYLALARGQGAGALERGASRPQSAGDELPPRALGKGLCAGAIRLGQRGAQRTTRFDAAPGSPQRAAELELEADGIDADGLAGEFEFVERLSGSVGAC